MGNPKLTDYFFRPLWGSWCQYSDVSQNIKIEKRKVEIPKWYSIDYKQEYECFHKPKGTQIVKLQQMQEETNEFGIGLISNLEHGEHGLLNWECF